MNSEATVHFGDVLMDAAEVHPSTLVSSASTAHSNAGDAAHRVELAPPLMQELSDNEVLLQVGNGSKDALSILFRRHARAVFNVARRILRDDSEAEDLVQELFLFAFDKARLFDPAKGAAVSWIIQMTYHRAIDRRRCLTSRHHYASQEFKEEQLQSTRGQISIDEITARTLLNKLRKELSSDQRQILELHFFEGYSLREIAEKTGQTLGNVRHHYYRGLERLRSHVFPEKSA